MTAEPLVTLTDATKTYSGRKVLREVSLALLPGETVVLTGANGSGKSTLLRALGGLTALTSGSRRVRQPGERRFAVGYAPDHLPKLKLTAREYLGHMAAIGGMEAAGRQERIERLLARMRLPGGIDRLRMHDYSKGMLQKINLLQAMLHGPDLLLLDEPLGGLDREAKQECERVLAELKSQGTTIVLASHEPVWRDDIADRRLAIAEGRIVRDERGGRPASDERPRWRLVQCELPEGAGPTAFAEWDGVLRTRPEEGGRMSYWVRSDRSDALLTALLAAGAAILSVQAGEGETDG
ncbi:ATP-binding cassette domain-containing protein [Cohnella nanjingensis]|uniref:ATP-binding cassette domain-containing protein n=1 Tax=Cohnella nanjingensis TaxID=1387779 RepID=A0A7X0RWN8_9BACL|nr:ATP-binding cassette domain-containing protein [Cohnella nanjingensis]MBB6675042.1 ATP-binding cassette domain-containing protein [Cohnella nanjingensis]